MTFRISCSTGAMKSPRRSTDSFVVAGRYVFTASTAYPLDGSAVRLFRVERLQHLDGVAIGLHAVPRTLDLAGLVDDERRADDALAPSRTVAPRAVGVVDLVVDVRQERERERILLLERAMGGSVVARDAHHRDIHVLEGDEVVAEVA